MIVKGVCSPEFQKVKDIFQSYFDENKEIGANFALVKKNKVLINIYGGLKNSKEEWDENTIVNTFSVSKGVYASCVAKLVEEKELDIDKKVSFYWPEFKNNKPDIKVKDILSHRSGLYRFRTKVTNSDLLDFDKITKILENQEPEHRPGERTYYHAKTHGYLIENIIKKITKLNLKKFFKENFASKFNINFNFGFEQNEFKNAADLIKDNECEDNKLNELNAFNNPKYDTNFYNTKEWRIAGVPSMGGHGSALSIAMLYDLLANDLSYNNRKIISQVSFKNILTEAKNGIDYNLKLPMRWTNIGYLLRGGWMFGKNKENFGHNGWGGSLGFGDPLNNFGVSYVTRKINPTMGSDDRSLQLIKMVYSIIEK
ncbi:serine hydrolase [Pelagibacteraceae bacterium]|nr:serine hydrolase [Pelagibacteraceae bacterium]